MGVRGGGRAGGWVEGVSMQLKSLKGQVALKVLAHESPVIFMKVTAYRCVKLAQRV